MKIALDKIVSNFFTLLKITLIFIFISNCDNRYTIPTDSNSNIISNTSYETDIEYLNSLLMLNNLNYYSPLEIGVQIWENNRLTELKIQNYPEITILPNSINTLNQLKILKLDNNSIVHIPLNICQLDIDFSNFEKFSISGNYLCPNNIPYCVEPYSEPESQYCEWDSYDMTILQEIITLNGLNTTLNELGEMQTWISGRLTSLSITNEQAIGLIHTLPENFGLLNQLIYLNLSNNLISTLPESFGDLTNLEYLNLNGNQILYLPESFSDISILSHINLSGNSLSYLPENFSELEFLNYLDLSFNQFYTFPEETTFLSNLETLNLSNNYISNISVNLSNLNLLYWLDLHYNHIVFIPNIISELEFLNYLDLGHNQIESFEINLTKLNYLNTLFLDNNFLTTMTETICFSGLDYFNQYNFLIENNNLCIETIPECISNETILGYQGCIESVSKNLINN